MKHNELTPVFVTTIEKELEPGLLYISKEFGCAIHLCACGCGGKTVTPFRLDEAKPGYWKLTDNNGLITLDPSIGNWAGEDPYHAHYYIRDNKVIWT